MYWYKKLSIISVLVISGLQSCKPEIANKGNAYFDLKGYFKKEADRLSVSKPSVYKSASHNNIAQDKSIIITDWEGELALFSGSDINKPAWRGEYTVTETPDSIVYKAKKPELKVREVNIKRKGKKIIGIFIVNKTKNILYHSTEKLAYYPDSLYRIDKKQDVNLIGVNDYRIEGKFAQ
ncbi:hypothetical protein EOD41_15945 [Mucilaginibacter limnophilus]|uniref:Uncharacterized protein n=1 Tax=Mucilaginibacter limnophilus TaxID=1932778 RepID=A0A3S2VLC8_9SPHI|nr:hypothetical protein [Mucilaginibacter limnophilus]RVT99929.1 hypothetical protein EOD41_15945 [Mucilaginibacter limnophilus]